MNSISFGSTFKIKNSQDYVNESKIENFCEKNNLEYSSKIEILKPAKSFFDAPAYDIKTSIIAPDNKDSLVESYLANRGIKFNKLSSKDLLDKNKIESRIKDAPKNMKLVKVDVEKLNKLLANQSNNIEHCRKDYDNYFKDNVNLIIRSGDKITATTLHINPTGESAEDTVDYIKKFGSDKLNEDQILLMFTQLTDDLDHCMFFGMNDLGMDKIPVYVNKDTYKIGNALGIFE